MGEKGEKMDGMRRQSMLRREAVLREGERGVLPGHLPLISPR